MAEATVKKTISLQPHVSLMLEKAAADYGRSQNSIIGAALLNYIPTLCKKEEE